MTITQDQIPEDLRKIAESVIESHKAGHKAVIKKVGTMVDGKPTGFVLDCLGTVPAIEIKADGRVLYGGYTVGELEEFCMLDAGRGSGWGLC